MRNAFKNEKKFVMLTMVFFCMSFVIRIILASLQLARFYVLSEYEEVVSVQLEIVTNIFCDQLPFFFFMC